jgi:hypothetical protein
LIDVVAACSGRIIEARDCKRRECRKAGRGKNAERS